MKNEKLKAALNEFSSEEVAFAHRVVFANWSIAFLRYSKNPTKMNEHAVDRITEDAWMMVEAIKLAMEEATTDHDC